MSLRNDLNSILLENEAKTISLSKDLISLSELIHTIKTHMANIADVLAGEELNNYKFLHASAEMAAIELILKDISSRKVEIDSNLNLISTNLNNLNEKTKTLLPHNRKIIKSDLELFEMDSKQYQKIINLVRVIKTELLPPLQLQIDKYDFRKPRKSKAQESIAGRSASCGKINSTHKHVSFNLPAEDRNTKLLKV